MIILKFKKLVSDVSFRLFPVLFLVSIYQIPVYPWVSQGHETVACIAEKNISAEVMNKMKPLLEPGETLECIAAWADEVKKEKSNTAAWHSLDLPIREKITVADLPRYYASYNDNPAGNIVCQIKKNISDLKSNSLSLHDRQISLKFLVHFMGDLHSPLHVSDDNDKRGKEKEVVFFSPTSNPRKFRLASPLSARAPIDDLSGHSLTCHNGSIGAERLLNDKTLSFVCIRVLSSSKGAAFFQAKSWKKRSSFSDPLNKVHDKNIPPSL
ncbi:MAG: S1/P1 nuclease [Chitinivibrionales bacterium]|nr:S1/P1 nuclease [Chitinivibrionales bacterium]